MAVALRARDIPVSVFGSEPVPLGEYLGDVTGRWLLRMHQAHGVNVTTGVSVIGVSGTPGDYRIELNDGTDQRAETVLVDIGVEPADLWLRGSGVALGPGVLCDAAGRTSVPDIWAAGDVAVAVKDAGTAWSPRCEHGDWANAVEQGRQVGLNVARRAGDALPQLRSLWTEQYGQTLRVLGTREPGDTELLIDGELNSSRFLIAHTNGTRVHAIVSCGLDSSLHACRPR
jgi:NADPH-dependent 2,4-dienoyl-CoA reductase/sulfur reductase-like enzyme